MKLTYEQEQELKQALKNNSLSRYHKRLQVILFRSQGMTSKTIAKLLDFLNYTIWRLTKPIERIVFKLSYCRRLQKRMDERIYKAIKSSLS